MDKVENTFTVNIKRLDKELKVLDIRVLEFTDSNFHLWGLAEDKDSIEEWDITQGDILIQHPKEIQ